MSLDLLTTKDLIEELFKRFDHIVVAGTQVRAGEMIEHLQAKGDIRYCQGLTVASAYRLERAREERASKRSVENL